MKTIEAVIYVEPTAKGRPRATVVNGHVRAYTPAKTRYAEQMIQALIREQVADISFPPGVPLQLTATFYRVRPKSLPKRVTMPVTKPDLDNYLKTLCDALNRYAFPDDSQICTMTISKRFAEPGSVPRIELKIEDSR